MLRFLAHSLIGVGIALLILGPHAMQEALADTQICHERDSDTGVCTLSVTIVEGGTAGSNTGVSSGRNPAQAPAAVPVCSWQGQPIECSTGLGNWSSLAAAWCRIAPTQPPVGDPAWGGNTEGAIYLCTRPGFNLTPDPNLTSTRWLPAPPEAVQVDPSEIAHQILARLNLVAINLGIFPKGDNTTHMSYVGWNTWLWAETPATNQWGPITSSDSASGITVTLSAEVDHIEWDMGDGTTLTCGKATPWSKTSTNGGRNVASPNCGHVYQAMDTYQISATTHWNVRWNGAGQSGTIPFSLTRTTSYLVGELQALNG